MFHILWYIRAVLGDNSVEVIFLKYNNLHELISHSNSSRKYFLSLPVAQQMSLHQYNDYIHSAAELREYARNVEKYERAVDISEEWL